jgi:formylglycine-generating enzyme required for sulfatase activity
VIEAECEAGWCRIPAGSFVIGSPENECGHPPSEETQVPVTLTRSFLIGQHEVTQAEWTSHGLTNPSKEITGNPNDLGNCLEPDCPVGSVNWFEAAAFSNVLSTAEGFPACYVLEGCTGELGEDMSCTGMTLSAPTVYDCSGYRLPTEAEWEYAARAGTTTPFYSGPMKPCPDLSSCYADPNLEAIAWYCLNADKQSHPVGQLMPNGWGLYDIIGNHYEWAHNVFTPSGYGDSPLIDPLGEAGSVEPTTARTLRGGAYVMWNSICRVSERLSASMGGGAFAGFGVRIVRTLAE